jgi:hypothetical protein
MSKKKKDTLGMIAVVNSGERWAILEWLHFHRLAGVDKIFLVLRKANELHKLDLPKMVHYCSGDQLSEYTPVECYQWLMDKHKKDVDWMILGDTDEFWFNPDKKNLKSVLSEFDGADCGGIIVPITQMGLSGHVERPEIPITDHMVLAQNTHMKNENHYKAIVKTSQYTGISAEHYCETKSPYVYQCGAPFEHYGYTQINSRTDHLIKCHHYSVRGIESIVESDEDPGDLWQTLSDVTHWSGLNEDATLYSRELRIALNIRSTNDAMVNNTMFLAVADWPKPEQHTKWFEASADIQDVPAYFVSYGKKWKSFIHNKVEKVLEFLKTHANKQKYAFVTDCADVVFVKPCQEILDRFNRIYTGGVLFNCDYDGVMWPLTDPMLLWHISTNYGRNGIVNAGVYCGLISDIIQLLEQILDVREQIIKKDYRQLCTKIFSASQSSQYYNKVYDSKGNLIDDDQWLLHIMQCEVNPLIKTDKYKQLFALVDSIGSKPTSVYDRNCLGGAGILHVSHIVQNNK